MGWVLLRIRCCASPGHDYVILSYNSHHYLSDPSHTPQNETRGQGCYGCAEKKKAEESLVKVATFHSSIDDRLGRGVV